MADEQLTLDTGGTADAGGAASDTSLSADLQAAAPTFTQADLDAKLAAERTAWEKQTGEKYGWIGERQQAEIEAAWQAAQYARDNPLEASQHYWQQAMNSPQHAGRVRESMARLSSSASATPPQPPAPKPGPDTFGQNADGTRIGLYSAEAFDKALTYHLDQLRAEFKKELEPLGQFREQTLAERKAAEQEQHITRQADAVMSRVSKLPGYEQHKQAISAEYAKRLPQANTDAEIVASLYDAYYAVVTPEREAQAQAEAQAQHARKSAANTGRPNGGGSATPVQTKGTLADELKQEFERRRSKTA